MTTLLARLGQWETRRAAHSIWTSSSKRKRGVDWICAECRARRAARPRRDFSADGLRLLVDHDLFPKRDGNGEERDMPRTGATPGIADDTEMKPWELSLLHEREPVSKSKESPSESDSLGNDLPHETEWPSSLFSQRYVPMSESSNDVMDPDHQILLDKLEEVANEELFDQDAPLNNTSQGNLVDSKARPFATIVNVDPIRELNYKEEINYAVLGGEPELILQCLNAAIDANDADFIISLPSRKFTEILHFLEPSKYIGKLGSAFHDLGPSAIERLDITKMRRIAGEYNRMLTRVVEIRRSGGVRLPLDNYAILLRGARDLGNRSLARKLWEILIGEGHVPDQACYNYYMAALVWNGFHGGHFFHKLRVTPNNMKRRRQYIRQKQFSNFRVGEGGLEQQVMGIFDEMVKNKISPNEESFSLVIIAAAREGNIETVKSILKTVWHVNVEAILAGKSDATVEADSAPAILPSLRPTPQLIYAVAHAFGINNDIPTAVRVVDFVSRRYSVDIPHRIWIELFNWTFVLARNHTGTARRDGSNVGELPKKSLMNLWDTMTGPPYYVKPDMAMYNRLIKNLMLRVSTTEMMTKMEEARQLFYIHRDDADAAFEELEAATMETSWDTRANPSLEALRNKWEYLDLLCKRDVTYFGRWIRLLLATLQDFVRQDDMARVVTTRVPQFLWEWRGCLPSTVRYWTATGYVEIEYRPSEQIVAKVKGKEDAWKRRRPVLDAAPKHVGETWLQSGNLPDFRPPSNYWWRTRWSKRDSTLP